MIKTEENHPAPLAGDPIFALDIGTRSIIGMVGVKEDDKVRITAIEKAEHSRRAMSDGQIEDIDRVAAVASQVKKKLEERLGIHLERVCVAAAGRALKTQRAVYELELSEEQVIGEELINQLEAGAIGKAEEAFEETLGNEEERHRFYLVGYTVCQYYLDDYLITNLKEHRGKRLKADLIATFLPSEVVGSLYTTMRKAGLEVASLTLEPIAAINAAIPENLRLLNLVLVDIGAGTSDIAACRDGSIIGYTMATIAGDEVTEIIMREYLVDFQSAERMKMALDGEEEIHFTDVLGFDQSVSPEKLINCISGTSAHMVREISDKILEVNGGPPSALFLAGGGSRLAGLRESITDYLGLDPKRVAIAGNNFQMNAFSDLYDIKNPEYATPLGIVVSAALNLINDSFLVTLNGNPAKLFRNGVLSARDILMMNGYGYREMIGRSGQNLIVTVNGKRMIFYGSKPEPAVLCINGKEGKLSDTIHAGDSIVFLPAHHGSPAQAQVGDIRDLPSGVEVQVNGIPVSRSTPLNNGDAVSFLEEDSFDSGYSDEGDSILPENDLTPQNSETGWTECRESGAAVVQKDKMVGAITDEKGEESVSFQMNGSTVKLPVKSDQTPYYLMDMLLFSGIDFKNLTGNVVLQVNGAPGYFQQRLNEGDEITIYEEKP